MTAQAVVPLVMVTTPEEIEQPPLTVIVAAKPLVEVAAGENVELKAALAGTVPEVKLSVWLIVEAVTVCEIYVAAL
jgi:hypothetical protein